MVIAKLTRPCEDKDKVLLLYCKPTLIGDILSDLNEGNLLETKIEFIKVVE